MQILFKINTHLNTGKQLLSCKKSDQNVEKNQIYETFYIDIKFCRRPLN